MQESIFKKKIVINMLVVLFVLTCFFVLMLTVLNYPSDLEMYTIINIKIISELLDMTRKIHNCMHGDRYDGDIQLTRFLYFGQKCQH